MFFELTELLTCPRCGPTSGLVLLVEEQIDRRVHSGWLGCPNCRHDYPIREGVADLRRHPETTPSPPSPLSISEIAVKIAALSGLREGPGYLMVDERLATYAEEVAVLLPGLEVIAFGLAPGSAGERDGVSRILADHRLPLVPDRLSAAAIAPGDDRELVAAAARVLAPKGRLAVFDAREPDNEELHDSGLQIIAQQGQITVAEKKIGTV